MSLQHLFGAVCIIGGVVGLGMAIRDIIIGGGDEIWTKHRPDVEEQEEQEEKARSD